MRDEPRAPECEPTHQQRSCAFLRVLLRRTFFLWLPFSGCAGASPAPSPAPGSLASAAAPSASAAQASPAPEPRASASGEGASIDELLLHRGFPQGLRPRRCDRSSTEVRCVVVDVKAGAKVKVELGADVTSAGPVGCDPHGEVKTTLTARRASFRLSEPRIIPGALCRARAFLRASVVVTAKETGDLELSADNGEIGGLSLLPAVP